jgi:hypothetical protein
MGNDTVSADGIVFKDDGSVRSAVWGHRPSAIGWAGCAAALAAAAFLTQGAVQGWRAQQDLAKASEAEAASTVSRAARRPPQAISEPQQRSWRSLAGHLNAPWPAILDALEHAASKDVALVAIEPDPARSSVRVQAEAATLPPLLEFAQRLEATPPFAALRLLKHEPASKDAAAMRLTLELQLAARPERAR